MSSPNMESAEGKMEISPKKQIFRSTKQSTFSIDSILSHKLLSQQKNMSENDVTADAVLDKKTVKIETNDAEPNIFEKAETESSNVEKTGTDSCIVELNNNEAHTKGEDRYASRKHCSPTSSKWNNNLSCSCPHCMANKSKKHMFLPNGSIRDLTHVSYYGNMYDNPYYQRNRAPRYMEDTSNLKLSFHPSDDDRNSKRRRTIFTASQLERLEYEFQQQQYIVGQDRRYLARELQLNEVQVKVWFQNRRIKWRKYTHGYYTDPATLMVESDK